MMKNRAQSGFTLIEMMIVVAIIAILAAIAIPNYQRYVTRSWEEKARAGLQEDALFLDKMNMRFFGYTKVRGSGANSQTERENNKITLSDLPVTKLCSGSSCGRDYGYALFIPPDLSQYTLAAIPKGTQAKASKCGAFILRSNGEKLARYNKNGIYDEKDLLGNSPSGKDTSASCFK